VKPAPFDYCAPTSVDAAVAALTEAGEGGKVLAGGQSLVPMLALRLARFDLLVDLNRIDELRGVRLDDGRVRVGAMTRQHDVGADPIVRASAPLLALATPLIGHFQIRNRGSIGGSVAHADPAAEYPAVVLALDGELDATGPAGTRRIAAADFFTGTWTTALADDEILTALRFPVWGPSSGFAVEEVARRHGDFAIVGAACGVQLDGAAIVRASIALFGVASTPVRAGNVEAALVGRELEQLDLAEVGRSACDGLHPPDDLHASSALRTTMASAVTTRALTRAIEEARRG
jgi:aerobic carbon-monoxide dehydrogenase medium subunit